MKEINREGIISWKKYDKYQRMQSYLPSESRRAWTSASSNRSNQHLHWSESACPPPCRSRSRAQGSPGFDLAKYTAPARAKTLEEWNPPRTTYTSSIPALSSRNKHGQSSPDVGKQSWRTTELRLQDRAASWAPRWLGSDAKSPSSECR